MRISKQAPSPTRHDDRGTSLVEMMVTSLILAVLSATALGIVLTLMDSSNASSHRFQNLGDAQPVMDVLVRDIRAATSMSAAQPQTLTVVSALGACGGPTQITFILAASGVLTQTSVQPNCPGPGSTTSTRQLTSNLLYPGGSTPPLFSYYDLKNNQLSSAQAAATPSSVASVNITMVDNNDVKIAPSAATLTAKVWLLNTVFANS
jgi:prepilin-type N-terminal cleavage/methylation domain-containing protein